MQLPFREDFLAFLFEGGRTSRENLQEYPVTLVNLPLAVNPGAKTRPFYSKLELQCAQKTYQLENWNYADQAVFTWVPASCTDLNLLLEFPGDLKLSRRYPGTLGFATFLEELGDGQKIYALNEFSGEVEALAQEGVEQLTLAYRLNGAAAVRSWLHRLSPSVPQQVFEKTQPAARQQLAPAPLPVEKPVKAVPKESLNATPKTPFDRVPHQVRQQNGDWFTLQLMSLKSEKLLKELFTKHAAENLLWYDKTDERGRWYVVLSGAYPSEKEAKAAITSLPAALKKSGVYARTYRSIQAEMEPVKTSLSRIADI